MKKFYDIPKIEILILGYENVLTESGTFVTDPTDPDYIPDEEGWNQG